jgi:hypothetical protein
MQEPEWVDKVRGVVLLDYGGGFVYTKRYSLYSDQRQIWAGDSLSDAMIEAMTAIKLLSMSVDNHRREEDDAVRPTP